MTMELYGEQYNDMKGYRVVEGKESYNHYFGGEECNLPFCKLCGENMHQILCFDLKDERIAELKSSELDILPLVSCLNCAMVWGPQYFQLSDGGKTVQMIRQGNSEEWIMEEEDNLPVHYQKQR